MEKLLTFEFDNVTREVELIWNKSINARYFGIVFVFLFHTVLYY